MKRHDPHVCSALGKRRITGSIANALANVATLSQVTVALVCVEQKQVRVAGE